MSFERIKHLAERLKQRYDPAEADELRELQEAVAKEHADAEATKKAAEEKPEATHQSMHSVSRSSSERHHSERHQAP